MSTQQAQAPSMNVENSVIKHYKKQLIHRQHDEPSKFEEVTNTKIYELEGEKARNDLKVEKKVRRKRKNRNCRGQFRHEGMELIKLGTNQSHTLCKSKEPYNKPPDPPKNLPTTSVIQSPQYVHPLPQMVPERRNSRELQPRVPVIYRSPPQPEYRVPYHLPPYPHPPPTLPYRPTPTLPPPPYPVARSPPRPVPRSPQAPPTTLLHPPYFPFSHNPPPEKKRKVDEKIVAAIDLTVDNKNGEKRHKCQCECGKSMTQEVIISVKEDNTVSSTYLKGKMVNGVLRFDQGEENSNRLQNGVAKLPTKVPEKEKLPPLFLIDDLLAKGVRLEQKRPKIVENRVIVTPTNPVDVPKPKMKDHTVSSIISRRRQSADIDTISVSSSGSEPLRSPRSSLEKQIPHGKLYYYKNNNSFIRYFDDTQKKLFIDNITSDGKLDRTVEEKEIIELPKDTIFNSKDNLTVEEYVSEMTLVEKYIPKDFFNFYKFVTGYQIYNNNLPVSFLTFLKVYNTNGLKLLLQRYVQSLKQNGEACN